MKVAEKTPPDLGMAAEVGISRIVLRDITKSRNIFSDDKNLWYKNSDSFIQIKPCKVNVIDVLKDNMFVPTNCTISKCGSENFKTSTIPIPLMGLLCGC